MARRKKSQLENFDFPLTGTDYQLCEHELDRKLPLELFLRHEGHEIEIEGKKYFLGISNPKDTLRLESSTFKGTSPGATHVYGNLCIPIVNINEDEDTSVMGWISFNFEQD